MESILEIAKKAKKSSFSAANLTTLQKNKILIEIADQILMNQSKIIEENKKDLQAATERGLSPAMIDRLVLNEQRIAEMSKGVREVAALSDPVGEVTRGWLRPNGLKIEKVRIPLGVVGIIYESRPNVTVDAAALCLKSGNAVVLRGGSEAIHSNIVLGQVIREALIAENVSPDLIQVIPVPERDAVQFLLQQDRYIDLIIPRGGESLMSFVREHSKIPVIRHDKGVCHIFIDYNANLEMAEKIALNAKVQRPGVCNAMETLLVDERVSHVFLPRMVEEFQKVGVEVRGCPRTLEIVQGVKSATEEDWKTEYLDLIISVRVVSGIVEAMEHIQEYGSLHTEAIVTNDEAHAEKFLREMNASVVLVNASTRFNDGGELGLGAEIGISTSKLHAFGPMGLEELTTLKYVVRGEGQVRS